jgi:hypothetical protein
MKEVYIVKKSDLIGEIANFPIEVVQKMIEEQVKQGNEADVTVFQDDNFADTYGGGFSWLDAKDGDDFWFEIISKENFNLFFDRYPNKVTLNHLVYVKQNGTIKGEDIIELLKSYGGTNYDNLDGESPNSLYYLNPISKNIELLFVGNTPYLSNMLALGYSEVKVKSKLVEITMEEIAEKFGVDVSLLRIKNKEK